MAGDRCGEDADRAGARDEHVLADQVEPQCGVGGVAERIEDRGDVVADVCGHDEDVVGGDDDVIGERTWTRDADAGVVVAELAAATLAVTAVAAGDVTLTRHPLTDLEAGHCGTDRGDLAHELVAHHHRGRHGGLRPRIPVVDVQVGAADGGLVHTDQHVAITRDGHRHLLEPQPRRRLGLHERLHVTGNPGHVITSIVRPTRTKASTAWSMSASLCAADICVRMRALPCATTGYENAVT